MERVAWYATTQNSDATDAVREVAQACAGPALRFCLRNESRIADAIEGGLPVAVMAVSGASRQEVRWTKYLHHMLDPAAPHGLGSLLASAFFRSVVGRPPQRHLAVRREVYLGLSVCSRCGHQHHAHIDLLLEDTSHTVAVEQKTVSGASDWRCDCDDSGSGGSRRSQLAEYSKLAKRRAAKSSRTLHLVYLTRHGEGREDAGGWAGLTHAELGYALLTAVLEATELRGARRHSALALVMDLNAGVHGDWSERLGRLRLLVNDLRRPGLPRPELLAHLTRTVGISKDLSLCLALGLSPTTGDSDMSQQSSGAGAAYLRHRREIAEAENDAKSYLAAVWAGVKERTEVLLGVDPPWDELNAWDHGRKHKLDFDAIDVPDAQEGWCLIIRACDTFSSELNEVAPAAVRVTLQANSQPSMKCFREAVGADYLAARLEETGWVVEDAGAAGFIAFDVPLHFDSAKDEAERISETMLDGVEHARRIIAESKLATSGDL